MSISERRTASPSGLVGLALLAICFGAGCSNVPGNEDASATARASQKVRVKTVAVAATDVRRTSDQPATVHAYHRAEIRSRATGYVGEVKADIGDYVEAGATLAVILVPEMTKQRDIIAARIHRLKMEEQRAGAGVTLAVAGVKSAKAQLAAAKSKMSQVEASVVASQAEFDRTEDLVKRGSLQQRMLDEVRMKRDSQLAGRDATQSAIESAQAGVTVAEAQLTAAGADVRAAAAETEIALRQLEELEVLMDYAVIKAPFAGVVTQRSVEPGNLVRKEGEVGSQSPLFVVSQVDKLRVRIAVPEADASLVNVGDTISIAFPSFDAEPPMEATVTRRSGNLDPSTRTMLVEADVPNPDGKLIPGMFGSATINLATKVAARTLPSRAIRFDDKGNAYVYVVGDGETVSIAAITTGVDDGNQIEVVSGVDVGQLVIGPHLKRFTDGQQVSVLPD